MQFTQQVTVNASADQVWEVLGNQFNDVSKWASVVLDSKAIPDLPPGSGRICNVKGLGETYEKLENYDDQNREFTFTLESKKVPFFMRQIVNTWQVKPQGDNQAQVSMVGNITLMPVFSQLLSGRLKKNFLKQADGLLGELKDYVEQNVAHV